MPECEWREMGLECKRLDWRGATSYWTELPTPTLGVPTSDRRGSEVGRALV